jgi:uncharacterized protein (TIGR03437 family)
MSCRVIALILLSSLNCTAQFFGLGTPADGSSVFFATSLPQKNTAQPAYGKIFRVDANGLALVESRAYQTGPPAQFGMVLSNAYNLVFVDVSSDGATTAMYALRDCSAPDALCLKTDAAQLTTIATPSGTRDYQGALHLSANGKWAFGGYGLPHYSSPYGRLLSVLTGEEVALTTVALNHFVVSDNGRPIANDGTAVFADDAAIVLLQGSQVHRFPVAPGCGMASGPVIDAAARTVIYSCTSLQKVDLASGAITVLTPDGTIPAISDDGQTIVYLSSRSGTPQLWTIQADGSGDRQLTQHPLGITRAVLSGDGSVGYAVTLGGQLWKIATGSGASVEVIPRTPWIDPAYQTIAPGAVAVFTGAGLVDSAASARPPLPYSLGGLSAAMNGAPTLLAAVTPTSLQVLTPPDLALSPTAFVTIRADSPSPFGTGTSGVGSVQGSAPTFLFSSPNYIAGAPASAGAVIEVYASGLGATAPPVPYGSPAPSAEPFARLVTPFHCSAPVLFQGLAPGLAGVYQLNVQIPSDAAGTFLLSCSHADGSSYIWGLISVPPVMSP